jgi:hypothetical protein
MRSSVAEVGLAATTVVSCWAHAGEAGAAPSASASSAARASAPGPFLGPARHEERTWAGDMTVFTAVCSRPRGLADVATAPGRNFDAL